MNAWKDWVKIAACVVSLVPAAAGAGGFDADDATAPAAEFIATDQPEEELVSADLPVEDADSVLVNSPNAVANPGLVAEGGGLPIDASEMPTFVECCDAGGCTGGSSKDGFHYAAGYFNRVLREASPRLVGQVDALVLWQGNIPSRPILSSGTTVVDVNQLQTVAAAGARYGVFVNLDQCYAIEGNYFNVGAFAGQEKITPGTYNAANMPVGFTPPTAESDMLSSGQIQSAELNWRRRAGTSALTWIAGFRWVEWNQRLQIVDTATPAIASLDSLTGNDLYGGQLGADLLFWGNSKRAVAGAYPFSVNGVAKVGVFYNNAFQRTSEAGILGLQSASADQTSFFGEMGFNSSVRLAKWLSWRAGYSVFWLSGIASPADQLNLVGGTGAATINTNGSVLLHGVTTGFEARW